jgi:hypothetical protein
MLKTFLGKVPTQNMPRVSSQKAAPARRSAAPKRRQAAARPVVRAASNDSRPRKVAGQSLGASIGGKIGSWLGDKAGSLIKHLTGMGAYKISKNTILDPSHIASFSDRPNAHRIQHREFLFDVISSTAAFNVQTIDISPTLQSTFPWLASLANVYEQYRMLGAIVEYVPLSGDGTAQAQGYVSLATEYDSNKPAPANKLYLENFDCAVQSTPGQALLHPLECDPDLTSVPVLYTSPNGVPLASENKNFVSFANTFLAYGGHQANGAVLGSLYLVYDIQLIKPRMSMVVPPQAQMHWRGVSPSNSIPFGPTPPVLRTPLYAQSQYFNSSMVTIASNLVTIVGLPIGTQLLMQWYATGALITTGQFTIAAVGANTEADFYGGSYLMQAPQTGVASTGNQMVSAAFVTTALTSTYTWASTGATPGTGFDFQISIMNQPDA